MIDKYIKFSKEVEDALMEGKPIVALESTIISHGMPYPENVQTALNCEQIIKDEGCVPATIAIIQGVICIGLSKDEIDYIGRKGKDVYKTSRRDIPYVLANAMDGATTVASTMFIASVAGINVFATGGIGGVHRGASETFDISADLEELKETNVCVVCAGAKAILDLPKTLEVLETNGVPVIVYKQDFLPAFYSKLSPYKAPIRMDDEKNIATSLILKWELGLKGGCLVCNPIEEEYSKDFDEMNTYIEEAINNMNDLNIVGKDQTPYLLKRITEITTGSSLYSNIQLVYNNCHLASKIAKHYQEIINSEQDENR